MVTQKRLRLAVPLVLALAAGLLVLSACSSGASEEDLEEVQADVAAIQSDVESLDSPTRVGPVDRLIEVTGFEVKGTTNTDDLAAPEVDPETLSAGYGYSAPGFDDENPKNWRVASYMWNAGDMTAFQGDSIDLHTFILNGNEHNVWVEAPDGSKVVQDIEMNRGRTYNLEFDATQAGVYKLKCSTHAPTMTADIVVIPQS
jgi:plastocyanin